MFGQGGGAAGHVCDGLLGGGRPDYLRYGGHYLRFVGPDPVVPAFCLLAVERGDPIFDGLPDGLIHLLLQLKQPGLDLPLGSKSPDKFNDLLLRRYKPLNHDAILHSAPLPHKQPHQPFKALAEVLLGGLQVGCVGQDLEKLVVAQEVESGEELSLYLEVLLEHLLDVLEGVGRLY